MSLEVKNQGSIIIAGCGVIGSSIAMEFSEQSKNVVIIDICGDSFRKLHVNNRITQVEADATDIDTLRRCGADNASVFLVFTGDDNRNIMIAEIAYRILNVPKVVAGINDAENKGNLLVSQGIIQINTCKLVIKKLNEIVDGAINLMSVVFVISGIIALALLVYLSYVLFKSDAL